MGLIEGIKKIFNNISIKIKESETKNAQSKIFDADFLVKCAENEMTSDNITDLKKASKLYNMASRHMDCNEKIKHNNEVINNIGTKYYKLSTEAYTKSFTDYNQRSQNLSNAISYMQVAYNCNVSGAYDKSKAFKTEQDYVKLFLKSVDDYNNATNAQYLEDAVNVTCNVLSNFKKCSGYYNLPVVTYIDNCYSNLKDYGRQCNDYANNYYNKYQNTDYSNYNDKIDFLNKVLKYDYLADSCGVGYDIEQHKCAESKVDELLLGLDYKTKGNASYNYSIQRFNNDVLRLNKAKEAVDCYKSAIEHGIDCSEDLKDAENNRISIDEQIDEEKQRANER